MASKEQLSLLGVEVPTPEVRVLKQDVETYTHAFYKDLPIKPDITALTERVGEIFKENNVAAKIVSSVGFESVVREKKEIRGPSPISISMCIDGRLKTKRILGVRSHKEAQTLAGLHEVTKPLKGAPRLASGTLTESMIKTVEKDKTPLHFSFGHFSQSDPHHGCGAMGLKRDSGEIPQDSDLAAENLRLLEENARVYTDQYNQIARMKGRGGVDQLVVTGLIETDSGGLVFGYNTPNQLATTEITKHLAKTLPTVLHNISPFSEPGQLREIFDDPKHLIRVEEFMVYVVRNLLKEANDPQLGFLTTINRYIDAAHPKMTKEQKQAFRFMIASNVASQYLGGFFRGDHEFTQHNERFQTVSKKGINVGRHMYDNQVFTSNPSTTQEAIKNIIIKSSIMNGNLNAQKPHIVFISMPQSESEAHDPERADNLRFFSEVLSNGKVNGLIKRGEIFVIPIFVKRKTGEVTGIFMDSQVYLPD